MRILDWIPHLPSSSPMHSIIQMLSLRALSKYSGLASNVITRHPRSPWTLTTHAHHISLTSSASAATTQLMGASAAHPPPTSERLGQVHYVIFLSDSHPLPFSDSLLPSRTHPFPFSSLISLLICFPVDSLEYHSSPPLHSVYLQRCSARTCTRWFTYLSSECLSPVLCIFTWITLCSSFHLWTSEKNFTFQLYGLCAPPLSLSSL